MNLKKYYDNNGYLVGISAGDITNNSQDIPMEFEGRCSTIYRLLIDAPKKLGYRTHLKEYVSPNSPDSYNYEFELVPNEQLSKDELIEMFQDQLLNSVVVNTAPATKEGYHLVPRLSGTAIEWDFEPDDVPAASSTAATGEYLDPITYTLGMTVQTGFWYTDGNDIWEAINTGIPADFSDTTYFDIISAV